MGLDMYLAKSKRQLNNLDVPEDTDPFIYWRKCNAIHGWIVSNIADSVDECQEIPMTKADVKLLIDVILAVLSGKAPPEDAIPTTSGFFFGDTTYSDYYYHDLAYCYKDLWTLHGSMEDSETVIYQASW